MHDLDRTLNEFETGMDALESGDFEMEYWGGDRESVFDEYGQLNEMDEMELAASLLEIQDEQELEQFLGKVFKSAGTFLRSPAGQALGGILKSVAKKALPVAGAALGNLIAPGVGGAIGGNLASMAGKAFGLELEGLSPQDQEFEMARRYVRFATDAARNLNEVGTLPPQQAAKQAAVAAAQQHAPGLVRTLANGQGAGGAPRNGHGQGLGGQRGMQGQQGQQGGGSSGRWVRRGGRIILFGV